MKILQVSSAKNYGGGEKHFVDLCRGLADRGQEIFVALRRENNWQDKLYFLPTANIFHIPLRNSIDVFSARDLAKIMREDGIEIIHAHPARDYPVAAFAAKLYPRAKFILTRHVLFPMKSLHKITLKDVSKAIAVSSAVETNLQEIFPKEKIALIPNGIDVERFSNLNHSDVSKKFRNSNNIPLDAKLIGSVGELKKLKGQEDFILAAKEIVRKLPDTHFVLVGKDYSKDQEFSQKLQQLVREYELENKFTFIEWLEDTVPLLAALDIFVSPSHSESFGLAILEAMASGTPVVATKTEGAKELIKHEDSGKLVSIKNSLELATAICEILEHSEKQKLFGKNAQKFAIENFSLDKMILETERLYEEILSTHKHR